MPEGARREAEILIRLGSLIGGAAKVAKNNLNVAHLTAQEYEDVLASAALGATKAQKSPKHTEIYEFVAAKNEAMKFIISQIFEKGTVVRFEDYEGELEFVSQSQLEIDEGLLADMFLKHRVKRGRRGYEASLRDARICKLILGGYGNEGIAQEMGISPHNVRRYRTDIKLRLNKIIEEKGENYVASRTNK